MNKPFHLALGAVACATLLAACGGSGDDAPATTTPVATSAFTQSGEWTFVLPASGTSVCYDFEAKAQTADCTGTKWDLKVKSSGMTASLWTNGGTSGTGTGGAFGGPFDHTWTELQAWKSGTLDPTDTTNTQLPATVFLADSAKSVFTGTNDIQAAAFEYGVTGATSDHLLYPNFRVFLVTTDSAAATNIGTGTTTSPVYALQLIGYYGTPTPLSSTGTTSGIVTFRYVDRSSGVKREATVDARAGWVYYDLTSNTVSSATGTWQVAFNRYNVKLNGGESGTGTVAGFLGKTPTGFYNTDGTVVAAKFTATTNVADTLADLIATDIAVPTRVASWVKDSTASALNPAYKGTYPAALDYGWYKYYPAVDANTPAGVVQHQIVAQADRAALVRTGEGNGYARFQLASIVYATPTSATSAQTWTIKYDLQPSK